MSFRRGLWLTVWERLGVPGHTFWALRAPFRQHLLHLESVYDHVGNWFDGLRLDQLLLAAGWRGVPDLLTWLRAFKTTNRAKSEP